MLLSRYTSPLNRFFNTYSNYPLNYKVEDKDYDAFAPYSNIREGEFAYHLDLDLPGVKKEDINIDIKDNKLTISGNREYKEEIKEEDYTKVESYFGKFMRVFTLPENVDSENIRATNKDGVLQIVIPKLESKKEEVKRIEVA